MAVNQQAMENKNNSVPCGKSVASSWAPIKYLCVYYLIYMYKYMGPTDLAGIALHKNIICVYLQKLQRSPSFHFHWVT